MGLFSADKKKSSPLARAKKAVNKAAKAQKVKQVQAIAKSVKDGKMSAVKASEMLKNF